VVELPTYPFQRQRFWIETKPRKTGSLPEQIHVPVHWYYKMSWQLKPALQLKQGGAETTALSCLAKPLETKASDLRVKYGFDQYDELHPELDLLSRAFIVQAFYKLGWFFPQGSQTNASRLRENFGIAKQHAKLFNRMLRILAEDGIIEYRNEVIRVLHTPESTAIASVIHSLQSRFKAFSGEIEMLERCGSSLANILQGKTDPLQCLFPGGSMDTAERIYTTSPGPQVFNRLACEAITSEINSRTSSKIRILEIGAGTGGTTASLAEVIPQGRSEYWFTDISPLFTARAAERFKQYPSFKYRVLDIERDPFEQNFPTHQFDIIIAANVIHATADLYSVLQNIKTLLAPGGLLLLIEGTAPERWVDLTFGLTEGWWRFKDQNLRPDYPLISGDAWTRLLSDSGFSGSMVIRPQEGSHQALVMARFSHETTHKAASWLLVPDGTGFAEYLTAHLASIGIKSKVLPHGESLRECIEKDSCDYVVDLSALSGSGSQNLDAELKTNSEAAFVSNTLLGMQSLISAHSDARLWLITRGAQSVKEEEFILNLDQSTVWGIGKTFALEHPDSWGGMIDLDPKADLPEMAAKISEAILQRDLEDHIAYRDGMRYVARLTRMAPPEAAMLSLRSDRAYLITGAFGGLGLKVAKWMIERGARHLVLMGRTGLPDRSRWTALDSNTLEGEKVSSVQALERLGAKIDIWAADVCDENKLAELLKNLAPEKLGGVVHLAAQPDGSLIKDMKLAALCSVMAPKIRGTLVLHRLTQSQPLDFFVMFSSWASMLGARELGHYAAANQFMDAFAHYRRNIGLPALSLNWAAWDEIRAASDEIKRDYARGGLQFMDSKLALIAMERALAVNDPQIAIAAVDWNLLKPVYETRRRRPFLENVANVADSSDIQPAIVSPKVVQSKITQTHDMLPNSTDLIRRLVASTTGERAEIIVEFVRAEAAAVLRLAPADVQVHYGLFDLGMDSLMSVELKKRLEGGSGLQLPSTLTFNYPSVGALAKYIDDQLQMHSKVISAQSTDSNKSGDDADISEDQLAAKLAAALQEME
jgi:SAM-dependent methyltransferase/NAD(P)-dependent dehydrogenase (short-subunit alcohol dehydrogenase family)